MVSALVRRANACAWLVDASVVPRLGARVCPEEVDDAEGSYKYGSKPNRFKGVRKRNFSADIFA